MRSLSSTESLALDALSMHRLLELTATLVAVPSLGGTEHELAAQELMADRLEHLGMEVDRWEFDPADLARHPRYSAEVERSVGLGVVGDWGEDRGGRHLVLNGHVDVVPAGDLNLWQTDPWSCVRRDGRLLGRGTCDMKGGLACAVAAVDAIRSAGIELPGKVSIQSVIGEEDGGCGTLATLERGHSGDGAIVLEPTRCAIAPAQAGAVGFRLGISGLSAHGCIRDEGHSAIESFVPIFRALQELERRRNADPPAFFRGYSLPWPISIGTLRAGDWPSSVPDRLVCEGRLGVAIDESLEDAKNELRQAVQETADKDPWLRQSPPSLEWWGGQFEAASTAVDDPLVTCLEEAFLDVSGSVAVLEGMTFGADMRLLILEGGIPTVMFGPGDVRRAHTADEEVPIADLERVARSLICTILRFCG